MYFIIWLYLQMSVVVLAYDSITIYICVQKKKSQKIKCKPQTLLWYLVDNIILYNITLFSRLGSL